MSISRLGKTLLNEGEGEEMVTLCNIAIEAKIRTDSEQIQNETDATHSFYLFI